MSHLTACTRRPQPHSHRFFSLTPFLPVLPARYSEHYSHFEAVQSLSDWMAEQGIPGITGVDTRAVTKAIRQVRSSLVRYGLVCIGFSCSSLFVHLRKYVKREEQQALLTILPTFLFFHEVRAASAVDNTANVSVLS
jgi:hypothetical protein